MERIKRINIAETDSTNRWMHDYRGEEGSVMTVVTCDFQTAGRGQGSNKWESEAGQNLMFSIKTHPQDVPVERQYVMLEAGSLAVRDALASYTDGITIKWPNDIYFRDSKISGTLSECAINGKHIRHCIIGTGINVNQQQFRSDAPNPVSLRQITGHATDRDELLNMVLERFEHYLSMVNEGRHDEISDLYSRSLYRREGMFSYRDADGEFTASIEAVEPDGHLRLRLADGRTARYAFKEVAFVIGNRH